jgi:hypothetical protein
MFITLSSPSVSDILIELISTLGGRNPAYFLTKFIHGKEVFMEKSKEEPAVTYATAAADPTGRNPQQPLLD